MEDDMKKENPLSFDEVLNEIKNNEERKRQGGYNSIPFGLPSLNKHLPGITKGIYYAILSGSGIGKTKLAKFLFVLKPYEFIKKNPQSKIKLKIIYFALEESKKEFIADLICVRLFDVYGIQLKPLQLLSMGNYKIPKDVIEKVAECRDYFKDLEQYIEIVENIYNTFGMYNYCRNYADKNGTHYFVPKVDLDSKDESKMLSKEQLETLSKEKQGDYIYYKYVPKNPNETVLIINDHIGLISPDNKEENLHKAIGNWSSNYVRKILTKRFNYCVLNIQQQDLESSKQQFNYSGESVIEKLKPNMSSAANNKEIVRDYYVIMGLFSPYNFNIPKYLGYDITKLKNNFRSLILVKNRIGDVNLELPLYFNGTALKFIELPKPNSDYMNAIYNSCK